MAILKLIRFPNLLIVALTQYLIYYKLILSAYQITAQTPVLGHFLFFLLVLTTMLIAAGGYIINDIVDYDMDIINKPNKVFIGKSIQKQTAWNLYYACIGIGFLLATFIGFQTNNLPLLVIYPTAVAMLYFYSTHFKKWTFVGNLVVALFCAFVPMIVLLGEVESLPNRYCGTVDFGNIRAANYVIELLLAYSFFAFLTTLLREVIKDVEDIEGDKAMNCRTIPIVFGTSVAKYWAIGLGFSVVFGIYQFQNLGWDDVIGFKDYYPFFFLFIPTLYIIIQLFRAKAKQNFTHLSLVTKLLMLFGLIYLMII